MLRLLCLATVLLCQEGTRGDAYRHFMIRLPDHETIAAITPFVKRWSVKSDQVELYAQKVLQKFLTASEVDHALSKIHEDLKAKVELHAVESEAMSARRQTLPARLER